MKRKILCLIGFGIFLTNLVSAQVKYIYYNESNGLISGHITMEYQDNQDRFWFASEDGISMFENGILRTWKKGDPVLPSYLYSYSIIPCRAGVPLIAGRSIKFEECSGNSLYGDYYYANGFSLYDGKQLVFHENPYKDPPEDVSYAFEEIDNNRVWLISLTSGIKVYPPIDNSFDKYDPIEGISEKAPPLPYDRCYYDTRKLWIVNKKGLFDYDMKGKTWTDHTKNKDLKDITQISHFRDYTFFSRLTEMTIYSDGAFKNYGSEHKFYNLLIYKYFFDLVDSSIWIGTGSGLYKYMNGELKRQGPSSGFTKMIRIGDGFVTACRKGVYYYDGKEFTEYQNPSTGSDINLIKINDEAWALQHKCIYYTDRNTIKQICPDVKTTKYVMLDTLLTNKHGDIFIMMNLRTPENSLYRIDKERKLHVYQIPNPQNISEHSINTALHTDNSVFYFVTTAGLYRFTGESVESVLPWDGEPEGNYMQRFLSPHFIICRKEGLLFFPEGLNP